VKVGRNVSILQARAMASDPVHVLVHGPEDDQELELFMTPSSTIYHVKCMIADYWKISPMCQILTMVVEADDPRTGICSKELKKQRTLIASGEVQVTALPPVEIAVADAATLSTCMHGLDPTVNLSMTQSWESVTQCVLHVDPRIRETAVRALLGADDLSAAARDILAAGCLLDRTLAVRIAAVEVLQEMWPKIQSDDTLRVIENLVLGLEDWEEPMRDATITALSHMITAKDKDTHKAIRQRLMHFKPCVRIATLTVLENILPKGSDMPACLEICKMIEDPYSEVQKQAAKTLVAIANPGDPKIFGELSLRLSVKKSTDVRLTALEVFTKLAKPGDEKAILILQGLVQADPIPEVRQHAAEALAKVSNAGNVGVIKTLVISLGLMRVIPGALDPPRRKKKNRRKKKQVKNDEVVPSSQSFKNQKEASEDEDEAASSGSEGEADEAEEEDKEDTNLPGQVPEDEASSDEEPLPAIVAPPADEDWNVRFALTESLGKVARKNDYITLEALVGAMCDKDARVRRIALESFLKLAPKSDNKCRSLLAELLYHELGDVRHLALKAWKHVGAKGDELTQTMLVDATQDECAEVRKASLELLSQFARKGDAKVNASIAVCLQDNLAEIRLAALQALVELTNKGDKTNAAAVQARLDDRSSDVQFAARQFFSTCLG